MEVPTFKVAISYKRKAVPLVLYPGIATEELLEICQSIFGVTPSAFVAPNSAVLLPSVLCRRPDLFESTELNLLPITRSAEEIKADSSELPDVLQLPLPRLVSTPSSVKPRLFVLLTEPRAKPIAIRLPDLKDLFDVAQATADFDLESLLLSLRRHSFSGFLTEDSFADFLEELQDTQLQLAAPAARNLVLAAFRSVFGLFDSDNDKLVSFEELATGLSIFAKASPQAKLAVGFSVFDREQTGVLSQIDMVRYQKSFLVVIVALSTVNYVSKQRIHAWMMASCADSVARMFRRVGTTLSRPSVITFSEFMTYYESHPDAAEWLHVLDLLSSSNDDDEPAAPARAQPARAPAEIYDVVSPPVTDAGEDHDNAVPLVSTVRIPLPGLRKSSKSEVVTIESSYVRTLQELRSASLLPRVPMEALVARIAVSVSPGKDSLGPMQFQAALTECCVRAELDEGLIQQAMPLWDLLYDWLAGESQSVLATRIAVVASLFGRGSYQEKLAIVFNLYASERVHGDKHLAADDLREVFEIFLWVCLVLHPVARAAPRSRLNQAIKRAAEHTTRQMYALENLMGRDVVDLRQFVECCTVFAPALEWLPVIAQLAGALPESESSQSLLSAAAAAPKKSQDRRDAAPAAGASSVQSEPPEHRRALSLTDLPIRRELIKWLHEHFSKIDAEDVIDTFTAVAEDGMVDEAGFDRAIATLAPADLGEGRRIVQHLLRSCFSLFDVNHDGKVDLPEFLAGIHMLCHGSMSSRLQTAFAIVDSNHDGAISKAEFFRFISAFMRVLMVAVLHAESLRVHVLGPDASGHLRHSIVEAPLQLSRSDVAMVDRLVLQSAKDATIAFFQAADVNHDGLVSFEEFNSLAKRQPDLIPWLSVLNTLSTAEEDAAASRAHVEAEARASRQRELGSGAAPPLPAPRQGWKVLAGPTASPKRAQPQSASPSGRAPARGLPSRSQSSPRSKADPVLMRIPYPALDAAQDPRGGVPASDQDEPAALDIKQSDLPKYELMKNLLTTVKFQDIGQVFLQFASGEATMTEEKLQEAVQALIPASAFRDSTFAQTLLRYWVQTMFSLLDRQGAGTINAQSAVLAFSLLMPVAADEKLLYSFLLSDSDGDSMLTVPDFFELYYCILAVVAAIALDPSQTVPVERIRGGLRTAALTLTSHLMVAFGLSPSDMDQKIGLQQFLETCIKQPSLMLLSDKLQLLLGRVQPTRQDIVMQAASAAGASAPSKRRSREEAEEEGDSTASNAGTDEDKRFELDDDEEQDGVTAAEAKRSKPVSPAPLAAAGSDVVSRIPLAGNVTVELTGDDIDTLRRMSIRDSAGRLELLIRLLRVKPEENSSADSAHFTLDQFNTAAAQLYDGAPPAPLALLFAVLDRNSSGTISRIEAVMAFSFLLQGPLFDRLTLCFTLLNEDSDGKLDRKGLFTLFVSILSILLAAVAGSEVVQYPVPTLQSLATTTARLAATSVLDRVRSVSSPRSPLPIDADDDPRSNRVAFGQLLTVLQEQSTIAPWISVLSHILQGGSAIVAGHAPAATPAPQAASPAKRSRPTTPAAAVASAPSASPKAVTPSPAGAARGNSKPSSPAPAGAVRSQSPANGKAKGSGSPRSAQASPAKAPAAPTDDAQRSAQAALRSPVRAQAQKSPAPAAASATPAVEIEDVTDDEEDGAQA